MTNSYFNHTSPFARFTTADALRLNSTLKSVEAGFDKLPSASELSQGSRNYSVATNVGGAYSITLQFSITGYSQGLQATFFAAQANPVGATLDINTLGPVTLKRYDGTNLLANDIKAQSINTVVYDGVNFRLTSVHGGSETLATTSATSAATSASSAAASAVAASTSAASAGASATTATSAAAGATSILTASRFGFRNALINPLFWMSQRLGEQTSGQSYAYSAGTYVRDRWKAGPTGITYSIANSTMTITAGSVVQVIQGRNIPFSGTYTLSWTGTASATVNGTSISNGGQIALSPGYQNATITFGTGTLYIPQFEFSPTKTQFELRPTDMERLLCFQYYQKSYSEFTVPGTVTHDGVHASTALSATEIAQQNVYFSVPMRASPAVIIYNPRTLNLQGSFDNMDNFSPQAYAVEITDKRFLIYNFSTFFTVGQRYRFHWVADAEL